MTKGIQKEDRYYLRDIINQIGLRNAPISFGAEKVCHIFKNFVVFAQSLSNRDKQSISDTLILRLIKQQNTEYLNNCGISTPKILDIQLKDDYILEIQEKAPGNILFYTNESNILNLFGDKEMKLKHTSFRDMSEEYRNEFCIKLMSYNLDTQKKLKNAPMQHFVKFLHDFKSITEYGLDLDKHGENFLYDAQKGFLFIDLPSMQSSKNKKFSMENISHADFIFKEKKCKNIEKYKSVSHVKILYDVCCLLADALKYAGNVSDKNVILKARKNNSAILEKFFDASKKAGYKITDEEYEKIREKCKNFTYYQPTIIKKIN